MTKRWFPDMATILTPAEHGAARLEVFEVSEEDAAFTRIRAVLHPDEEVPAGRYARLLIDGELWMSDTPFERRTNLDCYQAARGDVLIGGLGLGMVALGCCEKPGVRSVTVIEKHPDVYALMTAQLHHPKLRVVLGDVYDRPLERDERFDTLYFDIWVSSCTDDLADMARLHRLYRRHKATGAWFDCWRREYLRYQQRQDRRRGW